MGSGPKTNTRAFVSRFSVSHNEHHGLDGQFSHFGILSREYHTKQCMRWGVRIFESDNMQVSKVQKSIMSYETINSEPESGLIVVDDPHAERCLQTVLATEKYVDSTFDELCRVGSLSGIMRKQIKTAQTEVGDIEFAYIDYNHACRKCIEQRIQRVREAGELLADSCYKQMAQITNLKEKVKVLETRLRVSQQTKGDETWTRRS